MENEHISLSAIFLHFLRLVSCSLILSLLIFSIYLILLSQLIFFQPSVCSHCNIPLNWSVSFLRHRGQRWRHYSRYSYNMESAKTFLYSSRRLLTLLLIHLIMVFNNMTLLCTFTSYWYLYCYLYSTSILPQGPDLMNCYQAVWFVFVQFVLPV